MRDIEGHMQKVKTSFKEDAIADMNWRKKRAMCNMLPVS